jgi:hypothetical protein
VPDGTLWIPLFNGRDLSGWSLKGDAGKAYVENGEIVCRVTANKTLPLPRASELRRSALSPKHACSKSLLRLGLHLRARQVCTTVLPASVP